MNVVCLIAPLTVVALISSGTASASAGEAAPTFKEYVALGDSYTAGPAQAEGPEGDRRQLRWRGHHPPENRAGHPDRLRAAADEPADQEDGPDLPLAKGDHAYLNSTETELNTAIMTAR